jgi:hypothetical protein
MGVFCNLDGAGLQQCDRLAEEPYHATAEPFEDAAICI